MSGRITPLWAQGLAFCPACGNGPLSIEEIDWDACDACGGEGFDDDEGGFDDDD